MSVCVCMHVSTHTNMLTLAKYANNTHTLSYESACMLTQASKHDDSIKDAFSELRITAMDHSIKDNLLVRETSKWSLSYFLFKASFLQTQSIDFRHMTDINKFNFHRYC